ncbi:hypothetical protein [Stackebrandtia soli]|uniref:hypothetical protein n=1 Tax=Stackebrandtia soli TaxID=1892856 RepID=UPI0039E7674F
MGELVEVGFSFPAVVFTFAFVVVILFWLFVLCGLLGIDMLDGDVDADDQPALLGMLPVTRSARAVPVTVVLSLWISLAWFASVVVTVFLREWDLDGVIATLMAIVGLLIGAFAAWLMTVLLVLPLGRLYGNAPAASRHDFVGKTCRIRTQTVGADFGQAEITSTDGSSAIIPVRAPAPDAAAALAAGDTALIYEYDSTGEYFLVAPFDFDLSSPLR